MTGVKDRRPRSITSFEVGRRVKYRRFVGSIVGHDYDEAEGELLGVRLKLESGGYCWAAPEELHSMRWKGAAT